MAITKNIEKDYILEVQSLDDSIPSCSQYQCGEAGYFLYSRKNKWVFPFKRTRIPLNILSKVLPDNTVGIVSDMFINSFSYSVKPNFIVYDGECTAIEIRSKSLIPFRIKAQETVAVLRIVPTLECHAIIS